MSNSIQVERLRIFQEAPEELHLQLTDDGKTMLSAEWRKSIEKEEDAEQWHVLSSEVDLCIPATYEDAVRALARCRYELDKEIALMRHGIEAQTALAAIEAGTLTATDEEKAAYEADLTAYEEHEAFIAKVKACAKAALGIEEA